jgi:hypothetical protein
MLKNDVEGVKDKMEMIESLKKVRKFLTDLSKEL